MKKYSKYFYCALLAINIVFAIYFVSNRVLIDSTARVIPDDVLIANGLIKAELFKLSENYENKQIAIALMSSAASVCADNNVVDVFKTVRVTKPNLKLFILFSENTTDQDLINFRDNFKLDFEVKRMNSELDDYWGEISREYETPAIIILSNQKNVFASQNLSEIKKAIELF